MSDETLTLGVLPLGRPTFDVAFAEEMLDGMMADLQSTGHRLVGPGRLLMDTASTESAMVEIAAAKPDRIVILQVTFTDAAMTCRIADAFDQPLSIWAVPEPRLGGRLRLNAFCGLNLASHALGLRGRLFSWRYAPPHTLGIDALLAETPMVVPLVPEAPEADPVSGKALLAALAGKNIARIGAHPDGFDTCVYDNAKLSALTGINVTGFELSELFSRARAAPVSAARALQAAVGNHLSGMEQLDQGELDRSLRLKLALEGMKTDGGFDAFAIRCWPETFTEYGGAVCGPASMLGEDRVPCACEADVYGAATQLLLQAASDRPVFLVDLVDMDADDNTGVVWHCGQAPISMADPDVVARATIHTNRKMPLLFEFPLKPGPVTFVRLSQARGLQSLVIARGEMLKREMAFTGTSGVVRFERPAQEMLTRVIDSGLEHHMALAYGDHAAALESFAAAAGLPVMHL
ncbi:MAG: L-fucose/L-arabinose isomerase family protein [Hoeflea sp.]|uniref:L-fucose/L-arabinose isomerase family protein n=1 Tax=Hoeflea sp. TaxID=1940281 RepID=UPI003EF4D291